MTQPSSRSIPIGVLTDPERSILEFLNLTDDDESCTLAHDIASEVGVAPRSMGGRLRGLERRWLVKRVRVRGVRGRLYGWNITDVGRLRISR